MIALAFVLAAAAPASPPVPTGVNGEVLGSANEFSAEGPVRICTPRFAIELKSGERSFLVYSGIHSMHLQLQTERGIIELNDGNAWRNPVSKHLVQSRADMRIYDVGDEREFRYLMTAATDYSDGNYLPIAWVDGDALRGNRSDRRVLDRLVLRGTHDAPCGITYNYGWDVILEGEPMFIRPQSVSVPSGDAIQPASD